MKNILFLLFIFSTICYSQKEKDSLLINDHISLIKELKMMHDLDQGLRLYDEYGTFDKYAIDSINKFSKEQKNLYLKSNSLSKELSKRFFINYINKVDEENTIRLLELIERYGYMEKGRFEKLTNKELNIDIGIILVHSNSEKYKDKIIKIINKEIKLGNYTNKCSYGHLLWHLNGRNDFSYFLNNGYEMVKLENGDTQMKPVHCKFKKGE